MWLKIVIYHLVASTLRRGQYNAYLITLRDESLSFEDFISQRLKPNAIDYSDKIRIKKTIAFKKIFIHNIYNILHIVSISSNLLQAAIKLRTASSSIMKVS